MQTRAGRTASLDVRHPPAIPYRRAKGPHQGCPLGVPSAALCYY
jgi:hypothetical protein